MKANHQKNIVRTDHSRTKTSTKQLRLDIQMLRMRVLQQLKHIQQPWLLAQKPLCQYFNHYQPLPESKVNPQQLFKASHARLVRSENKIYFGQITGKVKHGIGIVLHRQGKVYEGEFVNNDKSGYGCQIYPNGNFYFGQFSQNRKHGKGTFYWFNLSEHLTDKYQSSFIQHYIGDWWSGLPDGQGIHQKVNGDYYKGSFKNGLKHGKGVQIFQNGDIYEGNYTNGLPEGHGQYSWKKGATYKGQFKQGFKNGYGIWQKSNNSLQVYKGHYLLDQRHGYGIYDWGNGYVYKGQFSNDIRNGLGQLYLQGHLVYKGLWLNGQTVVQAQQQISQNYRKSNSRQKLAKTIGPRTLKRSSNSAGLRNSAVYTRNLSATKKKNDNNSLLKYCVSFQNPQNTHTFQQVDQSHHHHHGHKDCIPHTQFGKMPKPTWKNPRINDTGPLTPKKYERKNQKSMV